MWVCRNILPGNRKLITLAVLFLAALSPLANDLRAVPSADGLYVTFTIKRAAVNLGDFTCSLNYQLAPRTTANFVRLATGSGGWLDFRTGSASRKPFYDGITFHRVVAGFVIQGGSPNGLGTDGPGYTIKDEFHPSLRHSKAGILSMANSGLNSNSSQFFVTLGATPWLDDVHSVFGEVVENLSIAQSVQAGDVIERATIIRVGTAAQAFDPDAQSLPTVVDTIPTLLRNASTYRLDYPQSDDAEYFVFHSPDLANWQQLSGSEFYIAPPSQTGRDVTAVATDVSKKFFIVSKVQYPDALQTPPTMNGKRIVVTDPRQFTFTWDLANAASGSYSTSLSTGTFPIIAYNWTQEAYRGRLTGSVSGLVLSSGEPITQVDLSFTFTDASSGTCKGNLIGQFGNQFGMAGPFTVGNLP